MKNPKNNFTQYFEARKVIIATKKQWVDIVAKNHINWDLVAC